MLRSWTWLVTSFTFPFSHWRREEWPQCSAWRIPGARGWWLQIWSLQCIPDWATAYNSSSKSLRNLGRNFVCGVSYMIGGNERDEVYQSESWPAGLGTQTPVRYTFSPGNPTLMFPLSQENPRFATPERWPCQTLCPAGICEPRIPQVSAIFSFRGSSCDQIIFVSRVWAVSFCRWVPPGKPQISVLISAVF